ncbi:Abi-like protein [Mogibacterium sp. CM50]|jgi:Abortive infection bacteriophage resistance protein|nr:Abi-like protein [Mogibacterium sp. CM50]
MSGRGVALPKGTWSNPGSFCVICEVYMDKGFTTFERQIDILKYRGLIIENEEAAMDALKRYGYYNIINGYKDPYITIVDGNERYRPGTTFEQIYALYLLDRQLRNVVMNAMLDVEDHLKTATAHVIAEAFTADQNSYLDKNNYRQGKRIGNSSDYSIDPLFNKFHKIIHDEVQPVKHYRETYCNVPPWILLKEASFGNIVNFIKLQKGPQKRKIISLIYNFPEPLILSNNDVYNLFMDTLFVCLDYRNCAAHGGRLYNFESKSKFRYNSLLHGTMKINSSDFRTGKGHTGLMSLVNALSFFDNNNISLMLRVGLEYWAEEHLKKFPKDKMYLSEYLPIGID